MMGAYDAYAQDASYPQRPVRIIVPFPPGQATDIIGRLVAQGLTDKWKSSVIVDNRPGAGGVLGSDLAAKAEPDGYTLLVAGSGPMSISPATNANLPYSPSKDFRALGLVATMPMVMVTYPGFPVATVAQFIEQLKVKPGEIAYASSGTGSTGQMATELFLSVTNTKMVHVPYKGSSPALGDVVAGRVPVTIESQSAVLPMVNSGKLRAIAVTSARRSSKFPSVPTLAESGLANFDVSAWIGVLAPAGVPVSILKKIAEDLGQILDTKVLQDRIGDMGLEAAPLGAQQFSAHIRHEIEKYTAIAKSANIKAE
jgi:tripartite-type tricarboxylate transporter receptor subunit TctC